MRDQKPAIIVGEFQPFESRRGIDTVLALRFEYNRDLVELLKQSLRRVKDQFNRGNVGGWQPDHKCWFCEKWAWAIVRQVLERAGYSIVILADTDTDHAERTTARQRSRPFTPADWSETIRRWHREMSLRFHPDRGGSTEVMQALNAAADRLKELVGV